MLKRDYRLEMRNFVQGLSTYSKSRRQDFFVIPQNGHELLLDNQTAYLKAIDGIGQESLFFGYSDDNQPTPPGPRDYLISLLDIAKSNQIQVLVTDYVSSTDKVEASYAQNEGHEYLSFAAHRRDLDQIPSFPNQPAHTNTQDIDNLGGGTQLPLFDQPGCLSRPPGLFGCIDADRLRSHHPGFVCGSSTAYRR